MLDGTFQTSLGEERPEVWNRSCSGSGAGTVAGSRDTRSDQQGYHPAQGIDIQKLKLKDFPRNFFIQIKFQFVI